MELIDRLDGECREFREFRDNLKKKTGIKEENLCAEY